MSIMGRWVDLAWINAGRIDFGVVGVIAAVRVGLPKFFDTPDDECTLLRGTLLSW
jgi:hypothetical protein